MRRTGQSGHGSGGSGPKWHVLYIFGSHSPLLGSELTEVDSTAFSSQTPF